MDLERFQRGKEEEEEEEEEEEKGEKEKKRNLVRTRIQKIIKKRFK